VCVVTHVAGTRKEGRGMGGGKRERHVATAKKKNRGIAYELREGGGRQREGVGEGEEKGGWVRRERGM
jgi:hypothetical protein